MLGSFGLLVVGFSVFYGKVTLSAIQLVLEVSLLLSGYKLLTICLLMSFLWSKSLFFSS
jgi:hypothetical protein